MSKNNSMFGTLLKTAVQMLVTKGTPLVLDRLAQNKEEDIILEANDIRISDLEERVLAIEERNKRVESDKAWEGSTSRKVSLALLTYLVIAFFLWYINVDRPWLNAIVPAIGFFLSTLTLPFFKQFWLDSIYKEPRHKR